jgi:hypothetical protein
VTNCRILVNLILNSRYKTVAYKENKIQKLTH